MKLIILDRDGVINKDSDEYIKSADEWIPIEGSIDAIARLCKAGYSVVLATNQSGLGRGLFDVDQLSNMHGKMREMVGDAGGEITGIFYCPHHPDDACDCRKPKTALLETMENELGITVTNAPFVGDTLKDIQLAQAKSCQPFLVKTGKGQATLDKGVGLDGVPVFDNLATVVDHLLDN